MNKAPEKLNRQEFKHRFDRVRREAQLLFIYMMTIVVEKGFKQFIPVVPVMISMGYNQEVMADLLEDLWNAGLLRDWDNQMVRLPVLENMTSNETPTTPLGLEDGRHNRGWV